jgi:hypothetical protein
MSKKYFALALGIHPCVDNWDVGVVFKWMVEVAFQKKALL